MTVTYYFIVLLLFSRFKMSRSPSSSSSRESNHTFSDESETESLSETSIEIAGYDDSIQPVPTEEEVSQYLQQLAIQNLSPYYLQEFQYNPQLTFTDYVALVNQWKTIRKL